MIKIITPLLLFVSLLANSQTSYTVSSIPSELKENANAVVRFDETVVDLEDVDQMTTYRHTIVTILNKRGLSALNIATDYDNSSTIKSVEAVAFDKNGNELKKYKKRDFIDVSASGGELYSDDRILFLDYTPTQYPFTIEFTYEKKTSSTVLLKTWQPIYHFNVSVEKSEYTLNNHKQIPIAIKKHNLDTFKVSEEMSQSGGNYSVSNINAIEYEPFGPPANEVVPIVIIAPRKFQLVETKGEVETWTDFGLWQNEKLLKNRDQLPQQTIYKISSLVSGLETDKEKVKTIYEFMQNKTRYISVQVGIGGWQPSTAEEVDRLGYGDCKGLTNYTKALLQSQGIESYYTIVDSQSNGRDLDEDFVALQGDHVILTVPLDDEKLFLECTSQLSPFNFLGTHTDNRKALMLTPEGGVMVRTHAYNAEDNTRDFIATVVFDDDLAISGKIEERSKNLEYDKKYRLETMKNDELNSYYKERWGHLNNMSLGKVVLTNNKDKVEFHEELTFEASNYVSKAGDRILLNPNVFNRFEEVPNSNDKRKQDIEIRRGKSYHDEITLLLPEGYIIESIFEPQTIETPFGNYKISIEKINSSKIVYTRDVLLKEGRFSKDVYNEYVDFIKSIVKNDKSKIVLIKK